MVEIRTMASKPKWNQLNYKSTWYAKGCGLSCGAFVFKWLGKWGLPPHLLHALAYIMHGSTGLYIFMQSYTQAFWVNMHIHFGFDWSIPKSNIALIDIRISLVHNIAPYLYVCWFSAHLMAARPHQASIAEAGYLVRGVGNGNLNAYLYGWALVV